MSQGELTSRNNKRETGSKTRQLEKDWLTNSDNEREKGLKSATMREKFAHKLRFEGDGSQSATMRGRLVHKLERDRE